MARKQKREEKNYLNYVFMKNPDFAWEESEDGMVSVVVEWNGFYHWIAHKVFHKPKQSKIALDSQGSFVWKQLDGERDMHQVSELVKAEFGEKAEPVYERLIKFVEIMRDHKFVILKEEKRMIKYIPYVLMFAVAAAVIYGWGLKKAQSQSLELAKMLYSKCEKIVCKELKKKEYLQKSEIEQLLKNVQVGQFYSKNKMAVTNPKEFINAFLEYMTKKGTLESKMVNGKRVYSLKKS